MLDTNVLVSGLLKRESIPGRLLQAVWDGSLELVLADPLPILSPAEFVARFLS